jgi:hypothetical protein
MSLTTFHVEQIDDDDTEPVLLEKLRDAADFASGQGQITFFTDERGKRLFAVAPIDFTDDALAREIT